MKRLGSGSILTRNLGGVLLLLVGAVAFLSIPRTIQADTLSPQRIQELTDLGAQIADRERAMKEAERQLQQPNLSETDRARLTNEVGSHRDFIKNTTAGIEAQGADQKKVLDRAIEARKKQYELQEARAKAAADPSDKKAQRLANRLDVELKNDYKDIGTLPPLPQQAMAPSSTTGAMAPTGTAGGAQQVNWALTGTLQFASKPKVKGGAQETATATIAEQTRARVTMTFEGKDENPDSWLKGIGYSWKSWDAFSPKVEYSRQDNTYSVGGEFTRQELREQQLVFTNVTVHGASTDESGIQSYGKTEVTIPQIPRVPDVPSSSGQGPISTALASGVYPVPIGEILIDNRPSYIKRFRPDANVWQISQDLEHAGLPGMDAWTPWRNPLGSDMFVYYLEDPSQVTRFTEVAGPRLDLLEPNEDLGGAPAPSLDPLRWPMTAAEALPRWTIRVPSFEE
ncbi:MAG: hypothetical protein AB1555_18465 [Nitrospirota bacterium]